MANPATLAIVRSFEGLLKKMPDGRITTYFCPANVLTFGIGSTAADWPTLKQGDIFTVEQCESIFATSFKNKYEAHVDKVLAKINRTVNPNQHGALSSWAYNCGGPESSAVWSAIAAGNYARVPELLARWNKGGGKVLAGLVRRRKAEGQLWNGDVAAALATAQATVPGTMPQVQNEIPKPTVKDLAVVAVNNKATKVGGAAQGTLWGSAMSWWDSLSTVQHVGVAAVAVVACGLAAYGVYRIVKFEKENWA